MPALRIPTFDDPFYQQSTVLEGTTYLLTFKYNQRENEWYLSIAQADGTPIVDGVKIVCGLPLIGRFASTEKPPGDFYALPNSKQDASPPGAGELGEGKRVTLFYITSDEIAARA